MGEVGQAVPDKKNEPACDVRHSLTYNPKVSQTQSSFVADLYNG